MSSINITRLIWAASLRIFLRSPYHMLSESDLSILHRIANSEIQHVICIAADAGVSKKTIKHALEQAGIPDYVMAEAHNIIDNTSPDPYFNLSTRSVERLLQLNELLLENIRRPPPYEV